MGIPTLDAWDAQLHEAIAGLGWQAEAITRLLLAGLAGGLVGLDREVRGREAGFRTNILVCVGSTMVMLVSIQFAMHAWKPQPGVSINVDPARIAYGVMTGVGFLGAGAIVHARGGVRGLTTAAGLWCVSAIGLAVGFGLYIQSAAVTLIVVAALWLLDYAEDALPKRRHINITLRAKYMPGCINTLTETIGRLGLSVVNLSFTRTGDLSDVDVMFGVVARPRQRIRDIEKQLSQQPDVVLVSIVQD